MVQIIIVIVLVGAALAFTIVKIVKKMRPGKGANPCDGCSSDCALKCNK